MGEAENEAGYHFGAKASPEEKKRRTFLRD
jgi:hypothetical protein